MATGGLRFVAMPGSLRRGSYTRAIAETLDELAPDDVGIEVLSTLGDLPLFDQDLEGTRLPLVVTEMAALVAAADALVIVTPEYNHSMPGVLKNALDWLSRLPTLPMECKPVAIQSASPGLLGGARAQEHIRQVLSAMNALVLNKPEVIVIQVADKIDLGAGLVRDRETRKHVASQLQALAAMVRMLAVRVA